MANAFDHLMYVGPDLELLRTHFTALTGVATRFGGRHENLGTWNALVGLGPGRYIELLAPDPAQDLTGTLGAELAALTQPRIHTFIVRTDDLAGATAAYAELGIAADQIKASRVGADGTRLEWQLVIPRSNRWGGLVPFFIDWGSMPHPADACDHQCRLRTFEVGHPDADALHAVWQRLGLPWHPRNADRAYFRATIRCPKRNVVLTG